MKVAIQTPSRFEGIVRMQSSNVFLARVVRTFFVVARIRTRRFPAPTGILRERLLDETGQVIPWVVLLLGLFLGMSALTVDIGHAMLVQRQLQVSADAAALAAAQTLPKTTYATVGMNYSGGKGSLNAIGGGVTVNTPTITGKCSTTVAGWGTPCTSSNPNAVVVQETASVPTFFAGILGIKKINVAASSTAAKGSKPLPLNVAIILDTTPSMDYTDNNCGATQLQCATTGVQELLKGLNPTEDRVSLFTFPNVSSTSVSKDYDCSTSSPTAEPYTFPSTTATSLSNMPYTTTSIFGGTNTVQVTYQVTGFLTDYRTSDTASSLNSSSNLAAAVGLGTSSRRHGGCTGMQTSQENTYYAGALYAAQSALLAEQVSNPGTQNVIVLLSDGNATAQQSDMVTGSQSTRVATNTGTYPSWVGECSQGVDAAQAAATLAGNNTTVFTIAYGSPSTSSSGNCGSDRSNSAAHKNITPCQAMQQMSSGWSTGDHSHFYSDYNMTGGDSGCQALDSNNAVTSLNSIFDSILSSLTSARLIPNNTP